MWKINFSKKCIRFILWNQHNDSLPVFKLNLISKKEQGTQRIRFKCICQRLWSQVCAVAQQPNYALTLVKPVISVKIDVLKSKANQSKPKKIRKKIRIFFPVLWTCLRHEPYTVYHQQKIRVITTKPWLHPLLAWIPDSSLKSYIVVLVIPAKEQSYSENVYAMRGFSSYIKS